MKLGPFRDWYQRYLKRPLGENLYLYFKISKFLNGTVTKKDLKCMYWDFYVTNTNRNSKSNQCVIRVVSLDRVVQKRTPKMVDLTLLIADTRLTINGLKEHALRVLLR